MADWSGDLSTALASGDPLFMKAMLARVPQDVLQRAIPYLGELARISVQTGNLEQALIYYDQLIAADPDNVDWRTRRAHVATDVRQAALPRQMLEPDAAKEPSRIPHVTFDPSLFDDPSIPESFDQFRVDGLRQHLRSYSGQQSSRNILARLEDRVWLAAWDTALSATTGAKVLFRGSELGVFALRALRYGATHVMAVEHFPLDARIATGMVQKHLLPAWHALHGVAAIQRWSEEERRASFESFAKDIDIVAPDSKLLLEAQCDCFVFPHIDHSLLGTGIVKAIRQHRGGGLAPQARVLPAKARVFAMGIQWAYPATIFQLQPMNALRWSLYPQALELAPEGWIALTAPTQVGEIDFENFAEALWNVQLPIVAGGTVDAIVFWFDLDLGATCINNAPGSDLRCIKPAVQYMDSMVVQSAQSLVVQVHVKESRLHFKVETAARELRSHGLPSWYIPMLLDRGRNDAYRTALDKALASHPSRMTLDIGAGCGLLSMMAAQAGADRVVGCEVQPAICRIGSDVLKRNRFDDRITLINKDCRDMKVPGDLAQRADLALFELFDCSLIGEGVLHFLACAREHLLTENARYLPRAARIRAMLIEHRLERIWDIDANLLNPFRYSPGFINVDAHKLIYRALSEPFDLFSFDFSKAPPTPDAKDLLVPASAQGTAGAVLFWFDLQLDATGWISNAPHSEPALHWKQGLQFMPEVHVDAAMQLPLSAGHDGSSLSFRWRQDALPKEAWSKLPRFDPRWLAATNQLEQQTRGLLQHCRQNADEYAKVAELANRFAIDPAAHDLDPIIAQRLAAMFFGN